MTKAILVSKTMVDKLYLDHLLEENEPETPAELAFLRNLERDPEQVMLYIARVSSKEQKNPDYAKLLQYCWDHKHFSVFEQVTCTIEVETDLNVATQILRHRSFVFQQFSRRYNSSTPEFVMLTPRLQDKKNRQNSIETNNKELDAWFAMAQSNMQMHALKYYNEAIEKGISKEQARYLLPTSLKTKLYITGNLRNFVHYVNIREEKSSQKEHRDLAIEIKNQLILHFPNTAKAVGWKNKEAV